LERRLFEDGGVEEGAIGPNQERAGGVQFEFETIFFKGMLENMADVSTPPARYTHGGSIRGRRYAITMNDCSKIFLWRIVLLMPQNLGADWVKAHYTHVLSTSQNQFSVTSSTLVV
jgi:hypothetical protein